MASVPVGAALWLATSWMRGGLIDPGGDEPHYLVMADSVVRDNDLSVRNDYFRTRVLYGPIKPHVFRTDRGWYPYHTPGLSILVAPWFSLAGVQGVRLGLCTFATLLPLGLYVWLSGRLSRGTAAWFVIGATLCLPFCFGSLVIYPDLLGGVVAVVAALWLVSRDDSRASSRSGVGALLGWAVFWLGSGLLPWLNVKFAAATVVLALGGVVWGWREQAPARRMAWLASPLAVVGPALLAAFNVEAYGTPLGLRDLGELTESPARALMIFLGLHLDQGQGLFLQQPLLLAGVWSLGVLVTRDRRTALFLILLYGSLIVPNSLQMARFGGGGPAGRFGWSAAWVWLVPIGLVIARDRDRLERVVRPAALVALAYQAALAVRWVPSPDVLYPVLDERIWARNSLFGQGLREALPSYYFWDFWSYLFYVPNVLATCGVLLLFLTGARAFVPAARRWLRPTWVAYAVACGALLPAAPAGGTPDQAERERVVIRTAVSQAVRRFEAERLSPGGVEGTTRKDALASRGEARATRPARSDRFIIFGPWIDLAAGSYEAELALRLEGAGGRDTVGVFEVTANRGRQLVARQVVRSSWLAADAYRRLSLKFDATEPLVAVEFRFIAEPEVYLLLDYVELVPVLPHPSSPD